MTTLDEQDEDATAAAPSAAPDAQGGASAPGAAPATAGAATEEESTSTSKDAKAAEAAEAAKAEAAKAAAAKAAAAAAEPFKHDFRLAEPPKEATVYESGGEVGRYVPAEWSWTNGKRVGDTCVLIPGGGSVRFKLPADFWPAPAEDADDDDAPPRPQRVESKLGEEAGFTLTLDVQLELRRPTRPTQRDAQRDAQHGAQHGRKLLGLLGVRLLADPAMAR